MPANPRYDGRPLVRLLELYVLRAIGHLEPADEERLEAMAPKLRELYDCPGAWHEVVAHSISLPPDLPAAIVALWKKNQAIAEENAVTLSPQNFAEMFVDQNLTG